MPNHSFADNPQPYPSPAPGFAPGDDGFGVIRMIDGHKPWAGGIDGANVHTPNEGGAGDSFDDEQGLPVDNVEFD